MKNNSGILFKCIAIPLLTGALAALISLGGMRTFESLNQPPLSPPGWLFPIAWTILYTLMGIASYLVLVSGKNKEAIQKVILVYAYQLVVNFLWPTFFFNFGWYLFSFFWLLLLWGLVLILILRCYRISEKAAYLLIPYLLWLSFAGYLNLAVWWLNGAMG